jgi:hypothetical protein
MLNICSYLLSIHTPACINLKSYIIYRSVSFLVALAMKESG